MGWVSFNGSNYKVGVAPGIFNQPPSTPPGSLQVTPANSADYCGSTAFPPVRGNWQFNDPDQGDAQSAFQIQVFQGGNLVVDTGKKTGSSQSYIFQLTGEQLLWNTAYSWQVKVWDTKDTASSFTSGPNFTTPSHHFPAPNFSSQPASPGIGEQVQFQDQTTFGPGSFAKAWAWDFESNNSVDSSLQNPTHAYAIPGLYQVTLQSSDDVGSCATVKSLTIGVSLPEWQEISPF
jgi:PKD repeat protein